MSESIGGITVPPDPIAPHRRRLDSAHATALASGAGMALLSLLWSGHPSYWFDEAASMSAVKRPWSSLWDLVHHKDAVHLVYYCALRLWTDLFGTSEVAARALSALLLGMCSVFSVLVAVRLLGHTIGRLTGVVMLALPGLTWAGFDARSSAFSCFTFAFSTWCLLRARERPSRGRWALYLLASALSVFVQVLTALGLLVHAVLMRDRLHQWLPRVLLLTPLLAFVALAHSQQGQLDWLEVTPLDGVSSVVFGQEMLGMRTTNDNPLVSVWGPAALAVCCWSLILLAAFRRRHRLVTLTWAFLPAAIVLTWSLCADPIYQERYFAWCVPAFAMLVATGLDAVGNRGRAVMALVLAAILVSAGPVTVAQRGATAKYGQDYRSLAHYVRSMSRGGRTALITVTTQSHAGELSYPDDFSQAQDVSQRIAPADTGALFGSDRSPTAALDRAMRQGYHRILVLHEKSIDLSQQPVVRALTAQHHCTQISSRQLFRTSAAMFTCP